MKATNQNNIRQNNNSRGLGLLACMVLACTGVGSSAAYGQNLWGDDCFGAFPWGGGAPIKGDGSWFINNNRMTDSLPPTMSCVTDPVHRDVWIRWTAGFTGTVTFSACDFDQDIFLAVSNKGANNAYFCNPQGNPWDGGPTTWSQCNDDACGTGGSSITMTVNSGENYLLRLGVIQPDVYTHGYLVISTERPGPCCMPDDTCQDAVIQSLCEVNGGSYLGAYSTCISSLCQPVGTGFTYQGKLMDNGVPVNDTVDLRFTLWDAHMVSNMVGGASTSSNVSVVDGLFTVTVNEANEFQKWAFIGAARWLEIEVRVPAGSGSWTTLTPRQAITAAPFSKL